MLQSVRATDQTEIQVLGHGDQFSEYQPTNDITPRYEQTRDGLKISVCRAQRLYNNHKWHNPVVVKLTNVRPALKVPPYAETGKATAPAQGTVILEGQLLEMAGAAEVTVGFELQEYLGFAEAMYNTEWTATATQTRSSPGVFRITVEGLKPGVAYQYRAVVKHPQLTVRGDHLRIIAK